jgi:hypothetical protein
LLKKNKIHKGAYKMKKQIVPPVLVIIAFLMCGTALGSPSDSSSSAPPATNSTTTPGMGMTPERHGPPPQAYEDCIGKRAGDSVSHTTREGKVIAVCVDSPKGLVARPNQPPGQQQNVQRRQSMP